MKRLSVFFTVIFILFIQNTSYGVSNSSECCCVMLAETKQLIYSGDAHKRHGMASTTKIMTAVTALENGNLNNEITVSDNAARQEGSSIYLRAGDRIKLIDLLYGLMLNSGNDAAVAVAEGVGGTTDEFVALMNEKAKEIGCKNTHFKNPNGLSDNEHYSTAYDMALITAYAMKNDDFKKIVSTKEHKISSNTSTTYLRNHNKLLWQYNGCIGVKTGFTKSTGRCLVSCAERDGISIIVVTLNDRDDWNDHKNLLNYGFSKTEKKCIIKKNDLIYTNKISGKRVNALAGDTVEIPSVNGRTPKISANTHIIKSVQHSIKTGTKIGYAEIFAEDDKLCEIDLLCGADIEYTVQHGIIDELKYLLCYALNI